MANPEHAHDVALPEQELFMEDKQQYAQEITQLLKRITDIEEKFSGDPHIRKISESVYEWIVRLVSEGSEYPVALLAATDAASEKKLANQPNWILRESEIPALFWNALFKKWK
jgi:hypothetical protein